MLTERPSPHPPPQLPAAPDRLRRHDVVSTARHTSSSVPVPQYHTTAIPQSHNHRQTQNRSPLEEHVYIFFLSPGNVLRFVSSDHLLHKSMYFFLELSLSAALRAIFPRTRTTNKLPSIAAAERVRPERTRSQPTPPSRVLSQNLTFPTVGCANPVYW